MVNMRRPHGLAELLLFVVATAAADNTWHCQSVSTYSIRVRLSAICYLDMR